MRILICDDDSSIRQQIQKLIVSYFKSVKQKVPEIICYCGGEDLLKDLGPMDMVFLDIEMPGMDGIYVGNKLKERNKNVIIYIVTSFMEYLDEAMRIHVFRYLPKPLEKHRFFRNLNDGLTLYHTLTITIAIETKAGIYSLSSHDIIALEAVSRKVLVHTTKGTYESIHSMAYWTKHLPRNLFFQSYRSFLVNLEHVTDFSHELIHLDDGRIDAYLTKRKYTLFKEAYLLYLESKG